MAPCYENIYDAYSAVAIGYGASDRLRERIFHIAVYSKHVNLGFNDGTSLADPKGILQGTGGQIRHITIKTPDDIRRPGIRAAYVRRARSAGRCAEAGRTDAANTCGCDLNRQSHLSKEAPAG
jgi:hypothetical protein